MCLATNSAFNCVLTIIEDVSVDDHFSMPIRLSLLQTTLGLNKELCFGLSFLLIARPLWSPLDSYLQHSNILRPLLLLFLFQCPDFIFQQDSTRPHTACVVMNYLTACETLSWPARSLVVSSVKHVRDIIWRQPGNAHVLAQQLDQIWQEIFQQTIRKLYLSMPRHTL